MTLFSIFHLNWWLPHIADQRDSHAMSDWSGLVSRTASAIRRGEIDLAEWLLNEHGDKTRRSAECLNLLGVIALSSNEWNKAARYWRRAFRVDGTYEPVRRNLRRYFELASFGVSNQSLTLGDEPEFRNHVQKERP